MEMDKTTFLQIRGKIATKINIAEEQEMKTFLHVVYNGYAEVSRNINDTRLWNTMLVPLK